MSRVHWHMGQALLPEHFYAQEHALREELALRCGVQIAPAWGLVSLTWDEFQLQKGIVSLQELSLLLPSGALIDVPGNTSPAFLNLAATGTTRTYVYLHLQSGYETVTTGGGDLAGGGIERVLQKVTLSTEAYSETGVESFKLAELACGPDGLWSLQADFCPALCSIGAEPFFKAYIERMSVLARGLRQVLRKELEQNHLAAEGQSSAKLCLRALFGFQAFLVDIGSGLRPHPYQVFARLRELYFDVCVFRGVHPERLERPYAHEELGSCIGQLLGELEEQLQVGTAELPYVEFELQDGRHVCELDARIRRSKDVFWLIQKARVTAQLDLSRVKLAAQSRISIVHERALRGVPFQKIESPPFAHGLSSTVEFHALLPGKEWDYAVSEGKLVAFDAPQLQGCRLYLYFREG